MRGIGLLALLIVIGIMLWMWAQHTQQVARTKQSVEPQVRQMAGQDDMGLDARDSIKLESDGSGGKLRAVKVVEAAPAGAMAKYFGLQAGDVIIEIAPEGGVMMPVSDMENVANVKDQLLSSYQRSQQIVVLRDGKKLTLPTTPSGERPADALPQQLDGVIKIPTH